jgi:type VI secretion system Hcp family effector
VIEDALAHNAENAKEHRMPREIGYVQITLAGADGKSKGGEPLAGEGDKQGTYAAGKKWIPIYQFSKRLFAPDANTNQGTAPLPISQDALKFTKLMGNASPLIFQAMSKKNKIFKVEIHLTKSGGKDAEAVAMEIVGENGIITEWGTVTERTTGFDAQGKHVENVIQYEEISLVCTSWTVKNNKVMSDDQTTMAAYNFQKPNEA